MRGVADERERPTAPFYSVPEERIVSIEHPCIVKNFDNGFKSLGGEAQIKQVWTPAGKPDRIGEDSHSAR